MRLDLRSLAFFRMALGLLLMSQAILLAQNFNAFYQHSGLAPSFDSSEFLLRILLFGGIPCVALLLVIGLATRLVTLLGYIGLILVQNANPQILQGGDVLLRLLLFWSFFLPLGQCWSIDAHARKSWRLTLPRTTVLATWAVTFQICFLYWFAAILKWDPLWLQSGNALFYALSIEHFTTPLGLYLRQYPELLRIFTWGTPCLEMVGPLLLLSPYRRSACRLAAVIFFLGFHLIGMQALLRIGLFPWACATAWLLFIPGMVWDKLKLGIDHSSENKATLSKDVPAKFPGTLPDWAASVLVVISFADIFAWNVASVAGYGSMNWMRQHDAWGNSLRLDQRWNMYAPHPRSVHGWLVVAADLADGTQVDIFTGRPISWDKPQDIGTYLGNDRWRRYLSNLFDRQDPQALQQYADYLVRIWNQNHDDLKKVKTIAIVFMKQATLPDLTITTPQKEVIYFHSF